MSPLTQFNCSAPFAVDGAAGTAELKRIKQRLLRSHHLSLRQVGCEVVGGSYILRGSVASYHAKQVAQVLAASVVGMEKIKNRIQVSVNPNDAFPSPFHSCRNN